MADPTLTGAVATVPPAQIAGQQAKPAKQDKSQAAILLERMALLRNELKYATELLEQVGAEITGDEKRAHAARETPRVDNIEGFFPAADHLMDQMDEYAARLGTIARTLKAHF